MSRKESGKAERFSVQEQRRSDPRSSPADRGFCQISRGGSTTLQRNFAPPNITRQKLRMRTRSSLCVWLPLGTLERIEIETRT
ncbi:hypothetical protein EYF80_000283 [Liparis tanakae]|uniref:Uncharacterized protein n=1 Tax=Liparis tanakae TaxID=230148 RepID=A0A4Z2JHL9_9TELE|nr:hypothetical protein EYF80_000283 [Liparis tanakae]